MSATTSFVRTLALVAALAWPGCSESTRRDQHYGTDAALVYHIPDASLVDRPAAADRRVDTTGAGGSSGDASPAADRTSTEAAPTTPAADAAASSTVSAQCTACEQRNFSSGACKTSGCGSLVGSDKELCEALLTCMRSSGCWKKDPVECMCGTASGFACASTPNGPCLSQALAATKAKDALTATTLFYNLSVPAGHATNLVLCDMKYCSAECSGAAASAIDGGGR